MKTGHSIKNKIFCHLSVGLLLSLPAMLFAETAYVTDKLMAGLHEDKTTDSRIIKILPTGTPLEILKQETELSQVKDPEGATGWINNQFLVNTPPAPALLSQAEKRANDLENELEKTKLKIKELEAGNPTENTTETSETIAQLEKENAELEQQSKSSQLKVGELQAKLAELRNQMSQVSSDAAMAKKIEELNKEKAALEKQLAERQTTASNNIDNVPMQTSINKITWQNILIAVAVIFIIGMAIGAYLLDLSNRRRHGGFRI